MSVNSHFLVQGYSVTEQTLKPVLLQQCFSLLFMIFQFCKDFWFWLLHTTRMMLVIKSLLGLPSKQAALPGEGQDHHVTFSSFLCTHKHILTFQRPKPINHLQFISQVSTLKRDTCTCFTILVAGFPSTLLVDSRDGSSIRLSLDPFCL